MELACSQQIDCEHGDYGPHSQQNKKQAQLTFGYHIDGNYSTGRERIQFGYYRSNAYNIDRLTLGSSASTRKHSMFP